MTTAINGHISSDDVKDAARGRWQDILVALGFERDILDGRHHPCPRCGGMDRFRAFDDVDETGGVLCNQCFAVCNGDGLAAVQWLNEWTFPRTIEAVALYLGIDGGTRKTSDIVAVVARVKRMPIGSFKAFGAKPDHRGRVEVARVPMFDQFQNQCSYFDIALVSAKFEKGLCAVNQPSGLFVATWPKAGDTVCVVEGVKDAAALHGCGFLVVGMPGSKVTKKFVRVFAGCNVIVIPDRDSTGEDSAQITAARLAGVAASVRIATLPGELKAKDGDGVRETLAMKDGETLLRQAIADAKPWKPATDFTDNLKDANDNWTNIKFDRGRTDRANSRRFLKQFGDRVLFCFPWDKWLVWTGTHWAIDDDGAILRLAMAIADSVWFDAKDFLTKDVIDFAVATSGAGKLASMLKLAAADVPISVDTLDCNPWLLNCPNGTVDLRTGELRPHRREDCLTKLSPTNFNPKASSYQWDRFLEDIFDDQSTVDFVQRLTGYFITGDVSEHILPIPWGVGSNGKSTFLTALQDTIGPAYTMAAPASLLTIKKTEAHPTELADLFGMRFVVASETEDGGRLAESLVKSLTGGDKIRARRMREDFWQFSPTHKLILCTNHKPKVRGTDHGIWRRLVLIPFTNKYWNPDKGETGPLELKQDKGLADKLAAEAEGILAWAVQGCLDWQCGGLRIPESVQAATAEYRSENDTLGRFVNECCLTGPGYRVKFSTLFEELEKWCEDTGDNLPSKKVIGGWLKEEFAETTSNGRWYLGIALKANE